MCQKVTNKNLLYKKLKKIKFKKKKKRQAVANDELTWESKVSAPLPQPG